MDDVRTLPVMRGPDDGTVSASSMSGQSAVGARAARYAEANRESIDAWNAYVAENGLPFADIMEQLA